MTLRRLRREWEYTVEDEDGVHGALRWAETMVKRGLPGGPVRLSVGRPRRGLDQNARFHAMCGEVAKQATYMDRKLSLEQWKVLFVSAHSIAEGRGADMVPGIEGEFVNIRESTSTMTKGRLSSLTQYVQAWCDGNGIKLSEGKKKRRVA